MPEGRPRLVLVPDRLAQELEQAAPVQSRQLVGQPQLERLKILMWATAQTLMIFSVGNPAK